MTGEHGLDAMERGDERGNGGVSVCMAAKVREASLNLSSVNQAVAELTSPRRFCGLENSAGSLDWPFPMLKYKYIFRVKYTEAILSNSTRKLLWYQITKMLITV